MTYTLDIDIHELLARHRAIALIWDADMLQSTYPHLTAGHAWEVLQACERHYTAENGLTWDDVAEVAGELYPDPADQRKRIASAAKAAQVIAAYGAGCERENLVDLLADAMHWCEGFGEPFDEFCGTARTHFAEEVQAYQKGA